jgi:hypothetical protein
MSVNGLEAAVDSIGHDLGNRFGAALAAKNAEALRAMFADRVDFRALTPNHTWEGQTPTGVIDDVVLGTWFQSSESMHLTEATATGVVGRRHGFVYRLRGTNGDGGFVIEQHAYAEIAQGKITWMRVLCSGFQPLPVNP